MTITTLKARQFFISFLNSSWFGLRSWVLPGPFLKNENSLYHIIFYGYAFIDSTIFFIIENDRQQDKRGTAILYDHSNTIKHYLPYFLPAAILKDSSTEQRQLILS